MPYYLEPSDRDPTWPYLVYIPETDAEAATCDCPAFPFARGRIRACKHLRRVWTKVQAQKARQREKEPFTL